MLVTVSYIKKGLGCVGCLFVTICHQTVSYTHLPSIYQNVHGLCLDGDDLGVGTFSGGLSRIDLLTKQVRHYQKDISPNSLDANNVFSICCLLYTSK